MRNLLVTGATGLVGGAVTAKILADTDWRVTAVARGKGSINARQRVLQSLREQWEFDCNEGSFAAASRRISVISGDVADFVPDARAMRRLKDTGIVLHCAADVNLGKDPYGHIYLNNTRAASHMLELARRLPRLTSFQMVSTAYVAGRQDGMIMEDHLYDAPFNNAYEKSKRKCELLLREAGLPFTIYRPSIVVGRLSDGIIRKPLAFYRILEFFGKLKKHFCAKRGLPPHTALSMPFRLQAALSDNIFFVPIDYVQQTITTLLQRPAVGCTYHVTGRSPVSTKDIATVTNRLLNVSGIEVMDKVGKPTRDEKLVQRFLADLLPYFSSQARFDVSNVIRDLGEESLDWHIGIEGLITIIGAYFRNTSPELQATVPESVSKSA